MYTKVCEQGNVIEVTTMERRGFDSPIIKLNKDEYLIRGEETGEIYQFNHSASRADSVSTLRRTFRKLRALINANCTRPENIRWVTLTYAENMTDRARLMRDFEKFIKRFRYKFGSCEYIVVAEPQERGAWHLHVLLIFPHKAPFISNNKMLAPCWGHGFTKIRSVKNIDNVGAYLSAYLGDVEVPMSEPGGVVKEFPDGTKKKFIKGGRLHLYPPGMRIYRYSKGVKQPEEFWTTPQEAETLVRNATLTYANTIEWTDERGFHQKIDKKYYNRIRKPSQNDDG